MILHSNATGQLTPASATEVHMLLQRPLRVLRTLKATLLPSRVRHQRGLSADGCRTVSLLKSFSALKGLPL